MNFEFKSENAQFARHLNELADKVAPAAQASALNSSAGHIRGRAVKIASKATGVPSSILKKRIAVPKSQKATKRFPRVIIFGGLWPVKVSKLKPKPRKLKSGKVKYKTGPGETINPGAFIGNNTNGSPSVFVRKSAARTPLANVTTEISSAVRSAVGGYSRSSAALKYYQKMLYSQMDRKVRSSLRRQGLDVT